MFYKILNKINIKIGKLFIGWRDKHDDEPFPYQQGMNPDGYNVQDIKWEAFVIEWNDKHYTDAFIVCYRMKQ